MAETKKSSKFFTPGWIQVVVAFVVAIVTQGFGIYHFGMLKVPMTEALGAQPAEVALGFSIYALAAGFASLVVGDVINKIKLRGSMLCSSPTWSWASAPPWAGWSFSPAFPTIGSTSAAA